MSNIGNESNFTQEVTIPSLGYLNPELPGGKVTQRCMMVADNKFLSGSDQDADSALNKLLQKTIVEPANFDINKLSLADTLYLLFKLRVLSYGKDYKFRTRCPECGKKIDVLVDLSELPVETLDGDFGEDLVFQLPNSKDTVFIKILTNEDIKQLNDEIKRRKRKNPEDSSAYVLRIVYSIVKIKLKNGKELTHVVDIEKYISALTHLDASYILAARDKITFGIAPTMEYKCPECREYIDVSLNFSGSFFRPTID